MTHVLSPFVAGTCPVSYLQWTESGDIRPNVSLHSSDWSAWLKRACQHTQRLQTVTSARWRVRVMTPRHVSRVPCDTRTWTVITQQWCHRAEPSHLAANQSGEKMISLSLSLLSYYCQWYASKVNRVIIIENCIPLKYRSALQRDTVEIELFYHKELYAAVTHFNFALESVLLDVENGI